MTLALAAPASWLERPWPAARFDDDAAPAPARATGLDRAVVGFNEADEQAVRRSARALHAACAELLPGYAAASREPWRQALLTAGCLASRPRRPATKRHAPPLVVEDVVQPSDVLCALWLARRCGFFHPGSQCGDGVGRRSACEIRVAFAPSTTAERRAGVMEALRANTAWRAYLAARGELQLRHWVRTTGQRRSPR
jgi:hypothetical protein